jgi:hypothetical protein
MASIPTVYISDRIKERERKRRRDRWFGGWWKSNDETKDEDSILPTLSEDEIKAFYDTIEFDANQTPTAVPKEVRYRNVVMCRM